MLITERANNMKILIIEFSCFNGVNMMYATHYYIDGKRVSKNTYYQVTGNMRTIGATGISTFGQKPEWEHVGSRQWSDKNKNGIRRDYTEILYERKYVA